jgi:hypothetical protein
VPRAPAEGASALNRPGISIFSLLFNYFFVHFSRGFLASAYQSLSLHLMEMRVEVPSFSQDRVHRPSCRAARAALKFGPSKSFFRVCE